MLFIYILLLLLCSHFLISKCVDILAENSKSILDHNTHIPLSRLKYLNVASVWSCPLFTNTCL